MFVCAIVDPCVRVVMIMCLCGCERVRVSLCLFGSVVACFAFVFARFCRDICCPFRVWYGSCVCVACFCALVSSDVVVLV